MRMFKLKPNCGNHIETDRKGERITYKSGNVVPSDKDLVTMFPNKFEVASGQDIGNVATAPKIPSLSRGKKKGKKEVVSKSQSSELEEVLEESEHGVDVTSDFPIVSKLDMELKVFEKSKWFTVVDPENDEVLNEKKLRKGKVEGFLKDYLQDDEDGDEDEEEDDDDKGNDDEDEDDGED